MDKVLEKDLVGLFKNKKIWFDGLSEENPLKDDKSFVLSVLSTQNNRSGVCIRGISERLCDDHDVILEAVKQTPWNLQYASDRLRADKHIVLQSLEVEGIDGFTSGGATFDCCDPELTDNEAFAYSALRLNPWCYRQMSDRLQEMKSVCEVAVSRDPDNFYALPDKMKQDKDVVKIALTGNPVILKDLSVKLRDDPEIVLASFRSVDTTDVGYIAREYQTDREGLKDLLSIKVSERLTKLIGSSDREQKLEALCASESLNNSMKDSIGQKIAVKLVK